MLTSTSGDAFDGADGILHPAGHLAGHRAAGRGQRHVDLDRAVVLDVDLVDQAELVDVGRDFRVVDRLQRRDDVVGQPRQFVGGNGRGRKRSVWRRRVGGRGLGRCCLRLP